MMYIEVFHMNRTQIYLERDQRTLLRAIAAERSTTMSQLIREAVQDLIGRYRKPKVDPLDGILSLYQDAEDREGSTQHDDLYD